MRARRDRGLTLVEVLVSLLLVGIAAGALATAFSTGLMAIRATRETSAALQAAQQEIERQRNSLFGLIASRTFPVPALGTSGSTVVETEDTDLKKVSVSVAWVSGGSRSMRVSLATRIAKGGINRQ